MPSVVKKLAVTELERSFKGSSGIVVVQLNGLSVAETETLRDSLAAQGVRMRMVPNKLALRVLHASGIEFPKDSFKGNIAIAAGNSEAAIHAAKVFTSPEVKKAGKVSLRAGVLEGAVLNATDTAALAGVPDKNTLRAKILGCLAGPSQKLVSILVAPQGALARVLQAKVDSAASAESTQ